MRNSIKYTLFLSALTLLFSSCEKVIDIKLNTAESKIVIEGLVTNKPGPYTVHITKSGAYFDNLVLPSVNNAFVTISNGTGIIDTLVEADSGYYQTRYLQGVIGETYYLRVEAEGQTYTASSYMHDTVAIDTVDDEYREARPNSSVPSGYRVRIVFRDPPGVPNYYMGYAYRNGVVQQKAENLTIFYDKYTDGSVVLRSLQGTAFAIGDTARVDLLSINEDIYNYFKVVGSISNSGNPISTTTPQNPISNISNGALGYFSAAGVTTRSTIIR